ncbi:MAG: 2-oxoacid:acceptor oxidoreductase family protein [Pseudomonadales bacterium]|jgi:2-oxoglutarate ferredoxin oxidoreductase subunit gamma|nr:2-oxoacid:acceptor oxidoreductase family protein [Pseudomonadales bacterium]MDP6472528.1 2-oxoacid:acceptor oxidoreductase family protein [Pseudomonadales bacterium]MDP6829009.1 2-oxoacid:acceptor oxidoreductase family protein [Pseudomonadales bacterium]MDP6969904.1 2-oxoacid:acceptor oxidoreductase family protein [Pseudomonadales bacterium]|tara:strand:- start:717 stop:1265 length:549 start_codon:yes stop_codon:yes gene_type:complete
MAASRPLQVRLSGIGGQGLILSGRMLAQACMTGGSYVAQSQSYEPTSRGGVSRSDLVVSEDNSAYPLVTHLDALVILDQSAVGISEAIIDTDTVIVVDDDLVPKPPGGALHVTRLPLIDEARRLRNPRVANVISLAALVILAELCPFEALEDAVERLTPAKFRVRNMDALRVGEKLAQRQAA